MSEPDWKGALRATVNDWATGGFLVQEGAYRALVPHIEAAYKRGLMAGRSQAGYRERRELPGPKLTDRQLECARLAAEGLTNAQIGGRLFLAENSIKTHLRVAMKKTGARSRGHLAALLVAYGQANPKKEE